MVARLDERESESKHPWGPWVTSHSPLKNPKTEETVSIRSWRGKHIHWSSWAITGHHLFNAFWFQNWLWLRGPWSSPIPKAPSQHSVCLTIRLLRFPRSRNAIILIWILWIPATQVRGDGTESDNWATIQTSSQKLLRIVNAVRSSASTCYWEGGKKATKASSFSHIQWKSWRKFSLLIFSIDRRKRTVRCRSTYQAQAV